jgi:HSP20 family molecular chaperone IbpA
MTEHPILDRAVSRIARSLGDALGRRWSPHVTRQERPHEVLLSFELHGVAREQLDISVSSGRLVCSGDHPLGQTARRLARRGMVRFRHSIPLPEDVDLSRVETARAHGHLVVRVARRPLPTPLA